MSESVDVFASNLTLIDWEMHELWIRGLSVTEAVAVMKERNLDEEEHIRLLASDLNDQFRLFTNLESLLLSVGDFDHQSLFQMDRKTKVKFAERYYSLDDAFCREILGRKLSSRLRKDLDEVAQKTGIQLKSCRRQFDNVKRIFKAVVESGTGIVDNVIKMFKVSKPLAEFYATLVFIGFFRFEVTKKKLASLPFEAFVRVSLILMNDWMLTTAGLDEPSLDRDALATLKDLKLLLDRDKEHKSAVCAKLQSLNMPSKSYNEIEANFKLISRNLIMFGVGIGNGGKDLREFFLYLMERIVDPLKGMNLTKAEVEMLIMNFIIVDETPKLALMTFMKTLKEVVLELY